MSAHRSNAGSLVGGAILIAVGLLALGGQIFRDAIYWSFIWPFIVIGFGALFFVGMIAGGKQVSGLAVPGSIFCGIGLLLLFQNLTNYWESWAYAWTLIIIFVGAGITIMGLYGGDDGQKRAGQRVMRIGLILFVIFGAFFEMIFASSRPASLRNILFPVLLILLGGYLILARSGLLGGSKSESPAASSGENLPPAN
jgi:hypothetical protein